MNHSPTQPDVLIIGAGPAGTTAGTYLARKGYQVTLLEKSQHPKFHVGESLLPMNMPIFESLGVMEAIDKIGLEKIGADFTYGKLSTECRTYRFNRAIGGSPPSAYEVKREEFDQILFEKCKESGVTTIENTTVTAVDLNNGNPTVTSRDKDGQEQSWNPRFVIDASGRDAFVAGKQGWKQKNEKHASAALFGHFKGVTRREGEDEGNISLYWHEHGWMWMIPLKEKDVMSVGAVCWPDHLKSRKTTMAEFLLQTIYSCPAAAERMQDAAPISPIRAASNYSYTASKCWDDGVISIGDAYTFIDPVFSSGVFLAMDSAQRAVPVIEKWLTGDKAGYRRECRKCVRTTNRGLRRFSWFIYRFTTPAMRNLFHNPRNIFRIEDAVISMLSGDVFNNKPVNRRLVLFKIIYGINWLLFWKDSILARKRRLSSAQVEGLDVNDTKDTSHLGQA